MGENGGASRRFRLFAMKVGVKASILEPGLELALGLAVPRGTHGQLASGGQNVGGVAAAGPARQREAGRKHRRIFAGDSGRIATLLLFDMHFYLISWVERSMSVSPTR